MENKVIHNITQRQAVPFSNVHKQMFPQIVTDNGKNSGAKQKNHI